jgi:hypothetical protein
LNETSCWLFDCLIDGRVRIKGDVSSQFLSALLMAAPFARGEVVVEVDGKRYAGQAVSIDVLEASAKAYVRALNNVAMKREAGGARGWARALHRRTRLAPAQAAGNSSRSAARAIGSASD